MSRKAGEQRLQKMQPLLPSQNQSLRLIIQQFELGQKYIRGSQLRVRALREGKREVGRRILNRPHLHSRKMSPAVCCCWASNDDKLDLRGEAGSVRKGPAAA